MTYQIDQSGKVEQTNKNTVFCLSNDSWDAILTSAKTKRQLQEIFRRHGQIRNFVLFTFCAGVSLLIKRNRQVKSVTVDREYYGKESVIKNIIRSMLDEKSRIHINFGFVGKQSRAHLLGLAITRRQKKPAKKFKANELLIVIKKTEVGKRLKDA